MLDSIQIVIMFYEKLTALMLNFGLQYCNEFENISSASEILSLYSKKKNHC